MTERKIFERAIYLQSFLTVLLIFFLFFPFSILSLLVCSSFFQQVAFFPLFFIFFFLDFSSHVSVVFEVVHYVSDSLFCFFFDHLTQVRNHAMVGMN